MLQRYRTIRRQQRNGEAALLQREVRTLRAQVVELRGNAVFMAREVVRLMREVNDRDLQILEINQENQQRNKDYILLVRDRNDLRAE
ncbi:10712_t:CDS:2, partial [Racocetra fulgida]